MRFENVLPSLDIKEFGNMTEEELGNIIENLRAIRTDVPETKQRRRKTRTKDYMAKQLLQMSEKLGMSVDDLMKHPDILKVLGEDAE